jgi:hypothetical protein
MIFIFEDYVEDWMSKFFRKAYSSIEYTDVYAPDFDSIVEIADELVIYANGSGNIKETLKRIETLTNEDVVVYLDTVPDNKQTIASFKRLKDVGMNIKNNVTVLPILCSEYNLLKSLPNYVLKSNKCLDLCINRLPWDIKKINDQNHLSKYKEALEDFITGKNKNIIKSFEKYSKLVLTNCVIDCATDNEDVVDNLKYYNVSFLCLDSDFDCKSMKLEKKAIEYVKEWKYFPLHGYLGERSDRMSLIDARDYFIKSFNEMSNIYKSICTGYKFDRLN